MSAGDEIRSKMAEVLQSEAARFITDLSSKIYCEQACPCCGADKSDTIGGHWGLPDLLQDVADAAMVEKLVRGK